VSIPDANVFIFGDPPEFFTPFDACSVRNSLKLGPLSVFRHNLASAIQVGSIPFQLVNSSVLGWRFNAILAAERIRGLKNVSPGQQPSAEDERAAFEVASQRMRAEMSDEKRLHDAARATLTELKSKLEDGDFLQSSEELLRQVLVMAWGAFEAVVSDVLRVVINEAPELALGILSEKAYKDVIFGRPVLRTLEDRGFNLSNCMGDLIVDTIRLDSIEKIREVCALVFKKPSLDTVLKDSQLWRAAQRRHLIVHRRAIIDQKYLRNTGEDQTAGHKLLLSAKDVENTLCLIRDAGLSVVSSDVPDSPSRAQSRALDERA